MKNNKTKVIVAVIIALALCSVIAFFTVKHFAGSKTTDNTTTSSVTEATSMPETTQVPTTEETTTEPETTQTTTQPTTTKPVTSTTKPTTQPTTKPTTKPTTTTTTTKKPTTTATPKTNPTTKPVTTVDPSKWSTAQIVDYYKKAAAATKGKSAQSMSIQNLPVLLRPLTGTINNAIQKNSAPFDGITGGYKNLTASDLVSANASKSGDYIIINMVAKEQIDGVNGKATEGTTGHLVSVLDGVSSVVGALGVPAEYPDGSVKLDYKNGFAKNIKINTKTGQIESGEWGYDLFITVNGAKISGITLRNVNATMIYRVKYPA